MTLGAENAGYTAVEKENTLSLTCDGKKMYILDYKLHVDML